MSAGPATPQEAYDPEAVPIRPAATVMLVEDLPAGPAAELRVLMLRRTARAVFGGDMWVYPGGRVDDEDTEIAQGHVVGLTAAEANRRLGLVGDGPSGLAYWVAALRECFEEAGLLLARRAGDGETLDVSDPRTVERLAQRRADLNAGRISFAEIIREEGAVLDAARIHYVAHWVTPLGPPRRFDTRFFLAAAPTGQDAAHDDNEIVHHEWVAPGPAVQRWRDDAMAMMTPTARMLMSLLPFRRAADAVAAAAADLDPHQIRVRRIGAEYRILLPDDPEWHAGDPDVEFGWVKLRPTT